MTKGSNKFNIIKWNARTSYSELQKRGILHEGLNGSYWVDVRFVSNIPGFVVQHITKKYIKRRNFVSKMTKNNDYWEIFYIDNSGKSYNADGFVQENKGNKSEGETKQIGKAIFYPYDKKVNFNKNGNMIITSSLKKIFGSHIKIKGHVNAGGLPSSIKQPTMNTLVRSGPMITHIVSAKWKPTNGENYTNITEKVYIGKKMKKINRPNKYINETKESQMN